MIKNLVILLKAFGEICLVQGGTFREKSQSLSLKIIRSREIAAGILKSFFCRAIVAQSIFSQVIFI